MYPPWCAMAERRRIVTHEVLRTNLLILERLRTAYQFRNWYAAWQIESEASARLEYLCAVFGVIDALRFDAWRRLARLAASTSLFVELLQNPSGTAHGD
jgi:hypothetical protein